MIFEERWTYLSEALNVSNTCQCLVIVPSVLIFIVLALFCSRRTWIWFETIAMSLFAFAFLAFPYYLLKFQTTSEPSKKALFVVRLYGAVLLSTGVTVFRTRGTRDATVPITLMMARVCMVSTLLMAQLFSYFESTAKTNKQPKNTQESADATRSRDELLSPWSDTFLPYFVLPTAFCMLGNLIHLLRSHDFNTYPQHNIRLNNHLRIDAWLMLLVGVMTLAFPRQILNALFAQTTAPDEVTLHVMRSCGAVCLGEAAMSLQAPGFLHNRDKNVLFGSRIIAMLFATAWLCAGHFLFAVISVNRIYFSLILLLPIFLNAFVGLVTEGTTIYVVPTPTRKSRQTVGDDGKKLE